MVKSIPLQTVKKDQPHDSALYDHYDSAWSSFTH